MMMAGEVAGCHTRNIEQAGKSALTAPGSFTDFSLTKNNCYKTTSYDIPPNSRKLPIFGRFGQNDRYWGKLDARP